ncbi:MAG TPA: cation-translocating P-type ATPase [Deltaproteobacteria bacterium]|nr:cation-translocating P-type ATPase [Deltaproteobacteria bacterium]
MEEVTLYIEGMDCEEEAKLVRSALEALDGVDSFHVNTASGSVSVVYDPSLLSVRRMSAALEKTGLGVRLERRNGSGRSGPWWREPRILTLSICAAIIAVTLVLEHLAGMPHPMAAFLYAAAVVVGGYFPARMGLAALKNLTPNIRTLMVAGAAGAVSLGLWEEAALLVLIYSLGDVLEAYASDRVRSAVRALIGLAPKEARIKRGGKLLSIPIDEVKVGETAVIRPGERIPIDGVVVAGSSSVDQAPITGESIPVAKKPGDRVFAGSVNQRGSLDVEVTAPFRDTTLGRIIHYVEEAETRKSVYQRFGETFGRYYTPSMFALASAVMVLPGLVTGQWIEWFYRGLVVLVVSCSCGIALSIPVAVVAAVANGARKGVLIKGGAHIEAAGRVRAVAFDKTGSLTMGEARVTDVVPLSDTPVEEIVRIAASVEHRSEHILADAVVRKAEEMGLSLEEAADFEAMPGMGARARLGDRRYAVGSPALCDGLAPSQKRRVAEAASALEREGKTVMVLLEDGDAVAVIAVSDEIRPEARETVRRLRRLGVRGVVMLTGDNETVAAAVARKAGIDEYRAALLPEQKAAAVKELRRRYTTVAMVGDGVNDAPAMVASDLAVAMGAAGTDVAIETGDIVLMSDDLSKIPAVMELSRKTLRVMKENIAVSLAVIAVLVPMALTGSIGLVPGLLANEIGGLAVILNGLRLLR